MNSLWHLLSDQPLLLLAALMFLGSAVGRIRVAGVHPGPAAVLFVAIAVSAVALTQGHKVEIPEVVGTLGLVLFTYTVGLISGPSFFGSLKRGWKMMLALVGIYVVAALVAAGLGRLVGLPAPIVAGAFAGATTNTPAMAAAVKAAGSAAPTVGYSIAYIWGVVGALLATVYVLRRQDPPMSEPLVNQTIRVTTAFETEPTVRELELRYGDRLAFTRLKHDHFANPTLVADDSDHIGTNDLLSVVGPRSLVRQVVADLGHSSSHDLVIDREHLDFRRMTISNPALAGRTIGELHLDSKFGAMVSRIRRADLDIVAGYDFVVQLGDRIRVIARKQDMPQISAYLGDSDRGLSEVNPVGLALGLALGIVVGLVTIPLPGGTDITVGAPAGTLLAGLLLGRLGRIGPMVTSMPSSAATALSTFGMITFLAYAGTRAGGRFTEAVTSSLGWKIAIVGFVVTTLASVSLVVAGRVAQFTGRETAGMIGGGQTQPAILAYASEQTAFDVRVGLGYALVYPAAMIGKIAIAQLLTVIG